MKITCGLRKALLGSTHCFANHTKVLPQQLSPECLSLKTNYCLRWHVNRKGTLHAVLELEAVLTVCWSRQQLWVQLHREYSNAAVENSLIAMGDFRFKIHLPDWLSQGQVTEDVYTVILHRKMVKSWRVQENLWQRQCKVLFAQWQDCCTDGVFQLSTKYLIKY